MYKAVWIPTIGERLCEQREPRNVHDRRAVAVPTSEDTLVGHAPREIFKIFWHFKNRCLLLPEKSRAGWVLKSEECLKTGAYGKAYPNFDLRSIFALPFLI